MRARVFLVAVAGCAVLSLASPAQAVAYEVTIGAPEDVVRGTVPVRAAVDDGVGEPTFGAYHLRPTGVWVESQRVMLDRTGERAFESVRNPIVSTRLPNGTYRLEVRVWGEVPPYNPDQGRTYARQIAEVSVDNPPRAPRGLGGVTGSSSVRLGWRAVPTSDRSDFAGYAVHRRKGSSCGGNRGFRQVATVGDPLYTSRDTPAGVYCFRVSALRTSVLAGTIASPLSEGAVVEVAAAGEAVPGVGLRFGSSAPAVPPPPPALSAGMSEISDGEFLEDIPYGDRTLTTGADSEAVGASGAPGMDARSTATLIALGLIMAVGALLIRRFLALAPER
jgi:hypothetical protein